MKSSCEILLINHFNELMQEARDAGWWVALDYREESPTCIYANFSGLPNRRYQVPASRSTYSLEDYLRWFAQCARNLLLAAAEGRVTLAAMSRAKQLLATVQQWQEEA